MTYRNLFSSCVVDTHSSGVDILVCLNKMGGRSREFVYNKQISMCEYHMCSILYTRSTGKHDTVSCSGAIMRFGNDMNYFNPLTPFGLDFDRMLPLSSSAVDYFSFMHQYYFQDGVRSRFNEDIISINCTNNLKTCLTFHNSSICFGNLAGTTIHHSSNALVHGMIVGATCGLLWYFIFEKELERGVLKHSITYLSFYLILWIVGVSLIYIGMFLTMCIPYMIGVLVSLFLGVLIYVPYNEYKATNTKS